MSGRSPINIQRRRVSGICLLLTCCWIFLSNCCCDGRTFDAYELAVGEWNMTLRGVGVGYFRPKKIFLSTTTTSDNGRKIHQPWWSNSLECTLAISGDGTFSIVPTSAKKEKSLGVGPASKSFAAPSILSNVWFRLHQPKQKCKDSSVMPLSGTWKLYRNPYCVTDRYYDQLYFECYPRILKQRQRKQKLKLKLTSNCDGADNLQEEKELQTIQMTLHCRLWGKYNAGGVWRRFRRDFTRGKLTHGTVLWKELDSITGSYKLPIWRKLRRPILASFSAIRPTQQPDHIPLEEDVDVFGY